MIEASVRSKVQYACAKLLSKGACAVAIVCSCSAAEKATKIYVCS